MTKPDVTALLDCNCLSVSLLFEQLEVVPLPSSLAERITELTEHLSIDMNEPIDGPVAL